MHCINEYLHGVSVAADDGAAAPGIRFDRIFAPNGVAVYSGEELSVVVEGVADLEESHPSWTPAVRIIDLRTGIDVYSVTGFNRKVPLPTRGEFNYRMAFQMNVPPGAYDIHMHVWDSAKDAHPHPVAGTRLRVEVLERLQFYGPVQMNARWEAPKTAASGAPAISDDGDRHIA
jgi:hypothetical protein